MAMRSDHKALLFLAAIAVLGATVRVARAVGAPAIAGGALEHQMQAADSAKRSEVGKRAQKGRRQSTASKDTGRVGTTRRSEHRDYRGRLDLDVATATELDSLPGVGPSLAKRIAADRIARGPFRELGGLRRVKGVSAKLLPKLDSLVAFSGAYKAPLPSDTILPGKARTRR